MKTNPSFRIFKPSTLVSLGIAIAAALVTQPMRAVSIVNNIVITENSSTSLSATYNGLTTGVTITSGGTDFWTVTFPSTVNFSQNGGVNWLEPGSSTLGNEVTFIGNITPRNKLSLFSDFTLAGTITTGNGTTINNVGTDSANGGSISVTLNDNGDVTTAPDTGSTLGLLSLSVVALLGVTRLRFLQLVA
jgi:hypothetical protein